MERGVRWAVAFVIGLFALLTLWTGYWSVLAGPSLATHPRNARVRLVEVATIRGGVYAANGTPIAVSDAPGERRFVGPVSFAHVVGYADRRYGQSGLERSYNKELLGLSDGTELGRFWAELTGGVWRGWDVITTLDPGLQAVAAESLGERVGAVVALDPRDGAVLAMLSTPGFHPDRVEEALAATGESRNPLFNRATQGQYPPGSAFKPIVMAAGLETGSLRPDQLFDDQGSTVIGGRRIENANGVAHGSLALDDALAVSSNTVFAEMAVGIGGESLVTFARRVGFGEQPQLPIPRAAGNLPGLDVLTDPAALGALGIGQSELLVTPLQMASAVSLFANGGWRIEPFLVSHLRRPDGRLVPVGHESATRVISSGTAHLVREAMIDVVERGTGTSARLTPGVVAGKTGTAEVGERRPHAWFVGFAPARAPKVVVAVIVEHGGYGGSAAAPIAKALFAHALVDGE